MPQEHGAILSDEKQVGSTLQCPHCGGHFETRPGSRNKRKFCMKCVAPLCDNPTCWKECVPIEARLDYAEGRKTQYDSVIKELINGGAVLL